MFEKKLPTLGFLGAGAIVNAMVDGFCTRASGTPYPIIVSDAREDVCQKLHEKYPTQVTAAKSLQDCVDRSDWVVIAVWPEAGEQVVRSLQFRPEHKIINVMFDKTVEEIRTWMNCEVDTILHMIPGTYLSFYSGPIVQCPTTPEAEEIFGHIGKIVNVDNRYQAAVFGALTGLFAPIFAVMDHLINWAGQEGVPEEAATLFITNMFAAVCQEACRKDRAGVHTMATVSTPGGINMLALELLNKAGAFDAWVETMKPIMVRTAGDIPKPSERKDDAVLRSRYCKATNLEYAAAGQ